MTLSIFLSKNHGSSGRVIIVCALALASSLLAPRASLSESPSVYIFDVLGRPGYAQSYNRMFKGEGRIPRWFGSANAAAGGTATAGKVLQVGGEKQELYEFCEPHNCGGHYFAVLFSGFGQRAVGASDIEGKVYYYGNPTSDERQILSESLKSNE